MNANDVGADKETITLDSANVARAPALGEALVVIRALNCWHFVEGRAVGVGEDGETEAAIVC